ncbi:MAG: hypothetical protein TREMPRED_001011 [Tremellales sp. Tagirdzhanova-0007]|nr:MAG: hypothetical protein TREMPRED_001011 [Tremellales sp. Tagirdzhanova-0007]
MSSPPLIAHPQPPPLDRSNTTSGIGEDMAGMDLTRQGPSLGYSFANRLPLVDRPFKCDECVQSFNRNHDLKRHKRIHLSVKPFGCDKCGKTFSRKDALRRHWLVKGCRGEDGATATITPMFPLSETRHTPGLSPPTPPDHFSPTEGNYISSFSHPSAPPPLTTLPARQLSDNSSQILVTPEEIAVQQQMAGRIVPPLEEPLVVDPNLAKNGTLSSSHDSEGYFEGVVGLKQDGTALIDHNLASSPYARYPSSPSANLHHHPYRRPPTLASPHKGNGQNSSPTIHYNPSHRSFSPSNLAPDGKPIFAMPFALQTNGGYALQQQAGLLAPPLEQSVKMDKQASSDSDQTTWQRWHRPSFPFPPPPGSNYHFDPPSPIEVQAYVH